MLGTACGGDNGGGVGPNQPPVAAFTAPACTVNVACSFTSTSTDDNGISSYSWNFGDNSPLSTDQNPNHTFATTGSFGVALTVTDAAGESNTATNQVTVSAAANVPPTAAFTYSCSSLDCTFTDGSTDADGAIATYAWEFGDGATSDVKDPPPHTYVATEATPFNVKLTVTDDDGATNSVTQVVTVTPAAGLQCDNGSGVFVACELDIEQRSRVTITLVSNNCTAPGNTLKVTYTTPAITTQTLFNSGCRPDLVGRVFNVRGTTPLDAGTQLQVEMTSGSTDPERVAPQLRVTGEFPRWTLNFDDGEDPSNPNEPDFNDIVLEVNAAVVQ